jgi:hypothetical protein
MIGMGMGMTGMTGMGVTGMSGMIGTGMGITGICTIVVVRVYLRHAQPCHPPFAACITFSRWDGV